MTDRGLEALRRLDRVGVPAREALDRAAENSAALNRSGKGAKLSDLARKVAERYGLRPTSNPRPAEHRLRPPRRGHRPFGPFGLVALRERREEDASPSVPRGASSLHYAGPQAVYADRPTLAVRDPMKRSAAAIRGRRMATVLDSIDWPFPTFAPRARPYDWAVDR